MCRIPSCPVVVSISTVTPFKIVPAIPAMNVLA